MLQDRIKGALRNAHQKQQKQLESVSLGDLRFCKEVLDDLLELVAFLDRGCSSWIVQDMVPQRPRPEPIQSSQQHHQYQSCDPDESTGNELLGDFQCIMSRVENLATKCKDGIEVILSVAQLRKSQKAIDQAEEVKKLAKLVFFLAPLSSASSLFGMNFVNLDWKLSLGIFSLLDFILLVILLAVAFDVQSAWRVALRVLLVKTFADLFAKKQCALRFGQRFKIPSLDGQVSLGQRVARRDQNRAVLVVQRQKVPKGIKVVDIVKYPFKRRNCSHMIPSDLPLMGGAETLAVADDLIPMLVSIKKTEAQPDVFETLGMFSSSA
ncbi:uncharacterized protein E0L32_007771 [Thyridium curvatum]|uniref:Uncharacterized protein n=1 Tax=Thyridium curvatum TaxID=1093900 RepID=A0A507B4N5_9PEZI|nr:uncharacterized protein E0L32_007771 [Thyridium curvatum]TPX11560.1 hypothetical protein E0L32_007771 [Thyridium curvatum]